VATDFTIKSAFAQKHPGGYLELSPDRSTFPAMMMGDRAMTRWFSGSRFRNALK